MIAHLASAMESSELEPAALAPSPSEFSELPSSCRADLSLAAWSALRLERPAAGVASEAVPVPARHLVWARADKFGNLSMLLVASS